MTRDPRPRRTSVRSGEGLVTRDRRSLAGLLLLALLLVVALCALATAAGAQPAQPSESAYRAFPYVGSRLAVWVIAQIHLNFAAFILGVPIFAVAGLRGS